MKDYEIAFDNWLANKRKSSSRYILTEDDYQELQRISDLKKQHKLKEIIESKEDLERKEKL